MDILTYDKLLEGLRDYNATVEENYGNVIVEYPTSDTTYPHTVLNEIRNTSVPGFMTCYDRVASVGYLVKIYAKTKGEINKKTIARRVSAIVDKYFSQFHLQRVSFNANDSVSDNSIYEILMAYSGNLHENRRTFI